MRGPKTSCTLYKLTETAAGTDVTETEVQVATLNAVLQPLKSEERVLFAKDTTVALYWLRFDYRAVGDADTDEVHEGNRISVGDSDFDIVSAEPIHNRYWELLLRETR